MGSLFGPSGPTGQGFNLRGAWAASTAYALYDVVTYNGETWTPVTPFTSGATFNSANWIKLAAGGGTELAYAEKTSNQTTISALVDISGLVIVGFVVDTRPVLVEMHLPFNQHTNAGGSLAGYIYNAASGGAAIGYSVTGQAQGANGNIGMVLARARISTPGTYTCRGVAQGFGTGTASIVAAAAEPASIRAVTV